MPKKFLTKLIPDHKELRNHHILKQFGTLLHHPNLWHMNRRSVPGAFSVGLFIAFMPIPFQMIVAAAFAVLVRVNIPISVTLVWITNPLTMAPIFYSAYLLGCQILSRPVQEINFELSVNWLTTKLTLIWEPFLLGCIILATISAILGNIVIRSFWYIQVSKSWRLRRLKRKRAKAQRTTLKNTKKTVNQSARID